MSEPQYKWKVVLDRQPVKAMRRLPQVARQRIDEVLVGLGRDPRPVGCRPVRSVENTYRVRVGDYRVIYVVLDDEQVVIVVRVARRGEHTYKGL